ncbi:MAG: DUF6779 domain-containing protein [Pseudonocardiaceae bacterium]
MTGPKDPPLQRGGGRLLMLGGLGLAVAAAAVLALGAEDAALLRLGILAALWAALFGTFAAVRLRRELGVGAERADELRTIYRLELDREIAARREHELTVERELREEAERRERDELAALRGELQSLRETLRNLLGGDVLVERVALRAESTRLLPISDHSRPVVDAHGRVADGGGAETPRSLTVAESPRPETGRDPWDQGHRPDPPQRRREPADVAARPAAQSRPQPPPWREAPPASGVPSGAEPDIFTRTAAELAGKNVNSAERSWSPAVAAPARSDAARSDAARSDAARSGSAGSVGPGPARAPAAWQPAVPSGLPPAHRRRADSRQDAPEPPPAPPVPPAPVSPGDTGSSTFQAKDPLGGAASRPGPGTGRHSRPSVPRYGAAPPAAPASTSNGAPGNGAHSNGAHGNGAHGNGAHGNGAHSNGNGAHSGGNGISGVGSHGAHATRQAGPGHRRAAEDTPAEPPAGGRRVDELLAAYGEGAAPRRRRRRVED